MDASEFGPYALEQRLAVGGTSEVFLARDQRAGADLRLLIVKRLLPQLRDDGKLRAIYAREGALQARVVHPAVVAVFEAASTASGEPYLATEYVDGIDCDRLLRRRRGASTPLPTEVSVHIALEILGALSAVHAATDAHGMSLSIVHRDVTPSNIYLAKNGDVKLGDFGLAFSLEHAARASEHGATLKGKFAYLAPEQVAGANADHRADLFSLAGVLAELLLGEPLFSGASQLAVLLSIRDGLSGKIERLSASTPPGLLVALRRGLAVDVAARYPTAAEFCAALAPYAPDAAANRAALAAQVLEAAGGSTLSAPPQAEWLNAAREASRRSGKPRRFVPPLPRDEPASDAPSTDANADRRAEPASEREHPSTARFGGTPSFARTADGTRLGPLSFAGLVEAISIGRIVRGDSVDYLGRGAVAVEQIEALERFLPLVTAITTEMAGIGAPDFQDELTPANTLEMLGRILRGRETGILFAENADAISGTTGVPFAAAEAAGSPANANANSAPMRGRKDLYFEDGRLMHATSGDASELLGAYLVRRGLLDRDELAVALAVLPRFGGRMGDTLIGLGLVGPVEVFRAIREQGRDRVADLFRWSSGKLAFYKGAAAPRIEFPLRLDLPGLMLAGLEAQVASDSLVARHRDLLDRPIEREAGSLEDGYLWPDALVATLAGASRVQTLRDLLQWAAEQQTLTHGDVIRSLYVLIACRKLRLADA